MYKTLYTREYQQMLALLRAKRTDAQVSQVELARRLAWTQADVSKCETGVRRLDVIELRIWLKALGYELVDFVQMLDNSAPLLPDQARPIGIVGAPR
jgi:transcriptional regulator with XRE-family HTH domain